MGEEAVPNSENWGEVGELHMPKAEGRDWGNTDAFADVVEGGSEVTADTNKPEISDTEFAEVTKKLGPQSVDEMHPAEAAIRFATQADNHPETEGEVVDFPEAQGAEETPEHRDVA